MMLALVGGSRVLPRPGLVGTCPGCGEPLIPKCGALRRWHWAHRRADCDSWYEPEGPWHREWKTKYPSAQVEVAFGPHRADIATAKRVIELQHSVISPEDIAARESFYATVRPFGMVWLLDGTDLEQRFEFTQEEGYIKFRWRRCPARWLLATRPICVDFGAGVLIIKKLRSNGRGWGYAISQAEFVTRFN